MTAYFILLAVLLFRSQPSPEGTGIAAREAAASPVATGTVVIHYKGQGSTGSTLSYADILEKDHMLVLEQEDRTLELPVVGFLYLQELDKNQTPHLLLPGDTVTYIKKSKAEPGVFVSRHKSRNLELALFPAMAKAVGTLGTPYIRPAVLDRFMREPAKIDSIIEQEYSAREQFLQHYVAQHQLQSEAALQAAEVLRHSYFHDKALTLYFGATGELRENSTRLLAAYLKEADVSAYDYPSFRMACHVYLSAQHKGIADEGQRLEARYYSTDKMLKPELAELMRFQVLNNTNAQKLATYPALVANFTARSENQLLKEHLATQQRLAELRKTIDYEVALLDQEEGVSDLQALLQKYKGHVVYVDLWASWCRPCLAEMPASEKLQQAYAGKKVKFLYLSLDEKKENWLKALARQQEAMTGENSFLLLDNYSSVFAKRYNITTIPRYLLLDKTGTVVDANAPRPGEEETRLLLDKYLMK